MGRIGRLAEAVRFLCQTAVEGDLCVCASIRMVTYTMPLSSTFLLSCYTLLLVVDYAVAEYPPEFVAQVQNYPNIMFDKDQCLPIVGSYEHSQTYVCDPNRLLSINHINKLNNLIAEVRNTPHNTECNQNSPKPFIAIGLVNKLKVGNESPDRLLNYAAIFSYYLYRNWGFSSACPDSGDKMIIFYSKEDGSLYTFAGKLLSKKLRSSDLIDIAVESRLSFSNGIYEGLAYLIQKYQEVVISGRKNAFGKI